MNELKVGQIFKDVDAMRHPITRLHYGRVVDPNDKYGVLWENVWHTPEGKWLRVNLKMRPAYIPDKPWLHVAARKCFVPGRLEIIPGVITEIEPYAPTSTKTSEPANDGIGYGGHI